MLPVCKVFAARVAPIHGAVSVAKGVVLIKDVVIAIVEKGAIGVIHPACRWAKVKDGAEGVLFGLRHCLLDGLHGFFNLFVGMRHKNLNI